MKDKLKKMLSEKMTRSISALERELSGLRTSRASVNLLNPVTVNAYGSNVPLSQISTISTPDPKTISIQIWDKEMIKSVEKAIAESNLGLNPIVDGQLIRMIIPPMSTERRGELVKVAHKYAEQSKVSVRSIRKDGMDKLKIMEKDGEISKDEYHIYANEIQKLTDKNIDLIADIVKSKEDEILKI